MSRLVPCRVPARPLAAGLAFLALACFAGAAAGGPPEVLGPGTRGPMEILFSRDGERAYVAEFDTGDVAVVDVRRGAVTARIPSGGREPTALATLPDDRTLLVTNSASGSLAFLDMREGRLVTTLALPGMPWDVVVSPDGSRAFVSLNQLDEVVAIDLAARRERGRVPTGHRPRALALSQNGRRLVCGNAASGDLSVIDTDFLTETRRLKSRGVNLNGLALLRTADLGLPGDGTLAIAGVMLPNPEGRAMQVEGGGVWSNFIEAIPLDAPAASAAAVSGPSSGPPRGFPGTDVLASLSLDIGRPLPDEVRARPPLRPALEGAAPGSSLFLAIPPESVAAQRRVMQAAADPAAVVLLPNLEFGFVANAGTHTVTRFQLQASADPESPFDSAWPPGWAGPVGRPAKLLVGSGPMPQPQVLRQNVGLNPRAMALSPDREHLWVANHLGNSLSVLDVRTLAVTRTIDLGGVRPDPAFAGRVLFHDAFATREQWFSCNSCHPGGGSDGRRWTFAHVPDGLTEARNTRSLRGGIDRTAPFRWTGHDESLEKFAQAEVTGLLKGQPRPEAELRSLAAFLGGLPPAPNPYRPANGRLSPTAAAGHALFVGKAGCVRCHAGPMAGGTGRKAAVLASSDREIDVPHLAGAHDSAPYLHDGRAPTLESIFRDHNGAQRHGEAHALTAEELRQVLEYVREL